MNVIYVKEKVGIYSFNKRMQFFKERKRLEKLRTRKGSYFCFAVTGLYELFPKLFPFYVSKKIKFFFEGTLMRQCFSCFLGFTECEKNMYTIDLVT